MRFHARSGSFWPLLLASLSVLWGAGSADAQTYSKVIVFGDSNADSGFYRALSNPGGGTNFNNAWSAAVAAGAGAPTSRPGLMHSEVLASYFGLTAAPSNTVGGTNYATSGAKNVDVNTSVNGGFSQAIPTATQIATYLSSVGNVANPTALYLIESGDNDVSFAAGDSGAGPFPPDPNAHVVASAQALGDAIGTLKAAGAQHFVVKVLLESFPTNDANVRALRAAHNTALFDRLESLGVTVVGSDFNATRLAMAANPSSFGFTTVSNGLGNTACVKPSNIGSAWSLLCSSTAGAPSQFASANADLTRLFADDSHMATAGQKILANEIYAQLPQATSSPLFSAVLPASRSVQVGNVATVFATIINSGNTPLNNCQISPITNLHARFTYQTTNASNQPVGSPNTPVTIAAQSSQSFVLGFESTAAYPSTDVRFVYVCTNTPTAVPLVGINTVKLVFDVFPVPDMIAVGLTQSGDGIARIDGPNGGGVFVVSSMNIGFTAGLTARTRITGPSTPLLALICRTNPADSTCMSAPTPTVSAAISTNEVATWGVFLAASGNIPPDPALYRVFLEFVDASNVVRGSTSVAVTTEE